MKIQWQVRGYLERAAKLARCFLSTLQAVAYWNI